MSFLAGSAEKAFLGFGVIRVFLQIADKKGTLLNESKVPGKHGTPGGIRTPDPRIRSPQL